MQIQYSPYQSLKDWYDENTVTYQSSTDELQCFHQQLMENAFHVALEEMKQDYGLPPCDYSWFVTGSAGRYEYSLFSDQDHGIIYKERNEYTQSYFLTLGEIITSALHYIGYPFCEGNVMSPNPVWCQSVDDFFVCPVYSLQKARLKFEIAVSLGSFKS